MMTVISSEFGMNFEPSESPGTSCLSQDVYHFRKKLISWGRDHFRPFPWRYTHDPYKILMAETLLHRTQAKQVEDVYLTFITRYPDIHALYMANSTELLEITKPLGLFWRSDLIFHLAKELVERFDSQVPERKGDLLSLPGVGDYIASSIRCFAYGHRDAIIDTNVMRVITRVTDIPFRDSLRRNRAFRELAGRLLDPNDPIAYNYAILDLANKKCLPKNPVCSSCPVHFECKFYAATTN